MSKESLVIEAETKRCMVDQMSSTKLNMASNGVIYDGVTPMYVVIYLNHNYGEREANQFMDWYRL